MSEPLDDAFLAETKRLNDAIYRLDIDKVVEVVMPGPAAVAGHPAEEVGA